MKPRVGRPIYQRNTDWVLCQCTVCGEHNYCEPHGTTAACDSKTCKGKAWTEHEPIEYDQRTETFKGPYYTGPKRVSR